MLRCRFASQVDAQHGEHLRRAWAVVEDMIGAGVAPTAEVCTALAVVAADTRCAAGMAESGWRAWELAQQHSLQPTAALCDALIECCAASASPAHRRGSDVLGAWRVWQHMQANALPVTRFTAAALIQACARGRHRNHGGKADSQGALEVLEYMQGQGIDIDTRHCVAVIRACSSGAGSSPRKAWAVPEWMLSTGKLGMNDAVCRAMLYVCAVAGRGSGGHDSGADVQGAFEIFDAIASSGGHISAATYHAMLMVCRHNAAAHDAVADAWRLFGMMRDTRVPITAPTCIAMIGVLRARSPRDSEVTRQGLETIFHWMMAHGLAGPVVTLLSALACTRLPDHNGGADVAMARDVFNWAKAGGGRGGCSAATLVEFYAAVCAQGKARQHRGGADAEGALHAFAWLTTQYKQPGVDDNGNDSDSDSDSVARAAQQVVAACAAAAGGAGADVDGAWRVMSWCMRRGPGFVSAPLVHNFVRTCGHAASSCGDPRQRGASAAPQQPGSPLDAVLHVVAWCSEHQVELPQRTRALVDALGRAAHKRANNSRRRAGSDSRKSVHRPGRTRSWHESRTHNQSPRYEDAQ